MSVVIRLNAGQAGVPFPGGEINVLFLKLEERFWGPSSVQFSGYRRPTLGSKQPRLKLTTHCLFVKMLGMNRAVPPLRLYMP